MINSFFFDCTQTRGRTGMEVNPLVFETSASTDSAIWASFVSRLRVQRYYIILNLQTFWCFFCVLVMFFRLKSLFT